MKKTMLFGEIVPMSVTVIPAYRRDEKDETIVIPIHKTGTSKTRKGGRKERRKMNALHGRNADTMHHAHDRHREKIYEHGEEMKEGNLIKATTFKEGQWWNIYMGKRWYNLSHTVRFFGTEEEATARLKELCRVRNFVGFCEPMNPTNEVIDQITGEVISDYDYDNWEDWNNYKSRSDFGKALTAPIGTKFTFGYVMTVTKK